MRIHKLRSTVFVMLLAAVANGADLQDEIPFRLVHGFAIIVEGGIGPLNHLNFLLDTGAVPSAISERIASRIEVNGPRGAFALLDKEVEASYVTVGNVRLGSIHAASLPMVVADLSRFERLLGLRIDAIIGLDLLADQSFTIDYENHKLTRGISRRVDHAAPIEIHTAAGAPYWVLPIALQGHRFRVLLDTGADGLVLFQGHPGKPLLPIAEETGPQALVIEPSRPALFATNPPRALQDIDGVFGPTVLRIKRIAFDWEHHCVRWETEK